MNEIDLLKCVIDHLKFGKMDDGNYNMDLIVFSDDRYFIEVEVLKIDSNKFVVFNLNNN